MQHIRVIPRNARIHRDFIDVYVNVIKNHGTSSNCSWWLPLPQRPVGVGRKTPPYRQRSQETISVRQIHINQVADNVRFNGFHANVLFWCFLVIVIDGYDIAIAGAAMNLRCHPGMDRGIAGG